MNEERADREAALPSLLQEGRAFFPFLFAMLLLCSATGRCLRTTLRWLSLAGLIKANVAPIMAEQYSPTGDYVETLITGETVIIDREGGRYAFLQKLPANGSDDSADHVRVFWVYQHRRVLGHCFIVCRKGLAPSDWSAIRDCSRAVCWLLAGVPHTRCKLDPLHGYKSLTYSSSAWSCLSFSPLSVPPWSRRLPRRRLRCFRPAGLSIPVARHSYTSSMMGKRTWIDTMTQERHSTKRAEKTCSMCVASSSSLRCTTSPMAVCIPSSPAWRDP
jgi:hypothetical protein